VPPGKKKTNAITISIRSAIYVWMHIQLQREGCAYHVRE
jgi:hypothetical protein